MVAEASRCSEESANSSSNGGASQSEVAALDGLKLSVKNTFINVSGADAESLETRHALSCIARLSEPNPRLFPSKVSPGNVTITPYAGVRPGEMTPESTAAPEDAHDHQNSGADEESDDDAKKIATTSLNIQPRHTRRTSSGGTPLATCPPVQASPRQSLPSRRPSSNVSGPLPTVKNTFLHFKAEDTVTPKGSQTCTARIDGISQLRLFPPGFEDDEAALSQLEARMATICVPPGLSQVVDQAPYRNGSSATEATSSSELSRCVSPGSTPMMRSGICGGVSCDAQRSSDLLAQAAARAAAAPELPDLSRCVSPGTTPLATPMGRTVLPQDTKLAFARDLSELESLAEDTAQSRHKVQSAVRAAWTEPSGEPKMAPPAYAEASQLKKSVQAASAHSAMAPTALRNESAGGASQVAHGRSSRLGNQLAACGLEKNATSEQSSGSPLSYPPPSTKSATGQNPQTPPAQTGVKYSNGSGVLAAAPQPVLSTGVVCSATSSGASPTAATFSTAPAGQTTEQMPAANLPSIGSELHGVAGADGQPACRPCAWFQKDGNCLNGRTCGFCHLCPPGELKNRKKQKIARFRKLEAAGLGPRPGAAGAHVAAATPAPAPPAAVAVSAQQAPAGSNIQNRQVYVLPGALPPQQ